MNFLTYVSRAVFSNACSLILVNFSCLLHVTFSNEGGGRQKLASLLSHVPHFSRATRKFPATVAVYPTTSTSLEFSRCPSSVVRRTLLLVDLSIPGTRNRREGSTWKKIVKLVVIKRRLRPLPSLFSRFSLVSLERQFSALRKTVVREVKGGERR